MLQNEPADRDNLAPGIPTPTRDPDEPGPNTYEWRITNQPSNSDTVLSGDDVVEFTPDATGTYKLELTAPDGTHQQTIRVFEESSTDAGPPRITLDGSYDSSTQQFSLTASAHTAPGSDYADSNLSVVFQADDRTSLTNEDISVDGSSATVPESAVSGTARVHVVAHGHDGVSLSDAVVLDADDQSVIRLNEQPDWIENATVYEIFVRAFAGTEQEQTDFAFLEEKVSYLSDLGVDAVWLTPILEAHTTYNSGGEWVHGYDITDYFQTAADLRRDGSFQSFVDTCHANGIKVIFDLVMNHTARQHPFFQDVVEEGTDSKYYDWYDRDDSGNVQYFYEWDGIPNLNYGNMAVREHMLSVVEHWAAIVDGFRCDVAWGVPHSFWKDVRMHAKSIDEEFLLLDETLPYRPSFYELEFDIHFDYELFDTLRNIGTGAADARDLYDAISNRAAAGFPDAAQFLQYIENHDVQRYLDVADRPAQKAAAAATFTLPGTPMLYYGQARGVGAAPGDGSQARADMPWSNYDEELLSYYRDLIGIRESEPVLQTDAELVHVGFDTDSNDVVAYGRDAGSEKGVVVLNFDDTAHTVEMSGQVGTTDAFSGTDVSAPANSETDTTVVEVDTLAVLPAEELDGLGDPVAHWDDRIGDDEGPGDYTYPTADAFYEGAFDVSSFGIYETPNHYQFQVEVAGGIQNPWDFSGGFSHQFLQIYIRDESADGGSTMPREGVNATMVANYHSRIIASGETGARFTDSSGSVIDDASLYVDETRDTIRVDVPKTAFDDGLEGLAIAPLLLGYDDFGTGQVRDVVANNTDYQFGGGADSGNDPTVIDMITPPGVSQSEALSYTSSSMASIPYVDVADGVRNVVLNGQRIRRWEDEVGDDEGPGDYTYPTADPFYEGAFDIESVGLYATDEEYRFVYTIAGGLQNPWDLSGGFSHQFIQVYMRDPDAAGGTTQARTGVDVTFTDEYHYRLVANGESGAALEAADGSVITNATVQTVETIDSIIVGFPKSAVDLTEVELAPLLVGYDGFGTGRVRNVVVNNSGYMFGGGTDDDTDPKVIDMITPEGVTQSEALAYSDSLAEIPFIDAPQQSDPSDPGDGDGSEGPPPVVGDARPTDPDGDGRYEDVNGDSEVNYADVVDLFENFDSAAVQDNPEAFDFNRNGRLDFDDIIELFESI